MATTAVFTLPTKSYASGTYPVAATGLPTTASQYEMVVDISQMTTVGTSYDFDLEISFDGGASWQFWNEGGYQGGPATLDRNGNPITTQKFGGGLDQPGNANRQIRGSVTVVGPITIGATLSVS